MSELALLAPYIFVTGGLIFASPACWSPDVRRLLGGKAACATSSRIALWTPTAASFVSGAELVAIPPQVFDLLDYLIRNREHVVSKDDLIEAIWEGRIVSETALTTRLNAARTAIGDSGESSVSLKRYRARAFVSSDRCGKRKIRQPRRPPIPPKNRGRPPQRLPTNLRSPFCRSRT